MDALGLLILIGFGIGFFAIWLILSLIATFFIFTGPPDTYDVEINDKNFKPAERKKK